MSDVASSPAAREPVAIVGVACRLPGGIGSLPELWSALSTGSDLVSDSPPPERFDAAHLLGRVAQPERSYTFAGGYLSNITDWDADFFGVAPREASRMDPQQRLALELAVEAFDDAAIDPARLDGGVTGVYIGVSNRGYWDVQWSTPAAMNAYTMTGTASSNVANRLSYFFDLHGPSMAVDTACSSSLVAVHEACQSLRRQESRLALAGGVNVLVNPYEYVGFSQASMLSPTGRCRSFSELADGYVRAEGGGMLILKRLSDALADADRIHAVIASTGVNSDGRTTGLALPSRDAQAALLQEVYHRSRIDPDRLVYFEAHGTGTQAGDPAECEAVGRALAGHRRPGRPLPIGSIKTNLGHLEPASGIAGLLKAVLVLRHSTIPASLHGLPANPDIDFAGLQLATTPVMTPTDPIAATSPSGAVTSAPGDPVAGVNSFGFGGTNAHAVLTGPPAGAGSSGRRRPGSGDCRPARLPVLISARSRQAVSEVARRTASQLTTGPVDLYDLAYTTSRRRRRHEHRKVVLAGTADQAAERLLELADPGGDPATSTTEAVARGRVAFVFSGNGSQWAGMGTDLLSADPAFREAVAEVDALLAPALGWSVTDCLTRSPDPEELARTEIAQPLLFTVQLALVRSLRSYGIRPAAVAGHSVGEIAAAAASGALHLTTAAQVLVARSRAQSRTAGSGRMAAVRLGPNDAEQLLAKYAGGLVIAAINSDQDVTISGAAQAVSGLAAELARQRIAHRLLEVDYAFHSPAMDSIKDEIRTALAGIQPATAGVPFYSTVTGTPLVASELTGDYWWRNIREPVQFGTAVQRLLADEFDVLVEVGPHPVLDHYLRRQAEVSSRQVAVFGTIRKGIEGGSALQRSVEGMLAAGAEIDWARYFPRVGRVVDLPTYPWQREPHWIPHRPDWRWRSGASGSGEDVGGSVDPGVDGSHPLLGERMAFVDPTWTILIGSNLPQWLADHLVGDTVVMPAAGYVEQTIAAGRRIYGTPVQVDHLKIDRALALPHQDEPTEPIAVQVSVSEEDGIVRVASRARGTSQWQQHSRGRVRTLLDPPPRPVLRDEILDQAIDRVDRPQHYRRAARAGLRYGPALQVLEESWVAAEELLARYAAAGIEAGYEVSPVVVDAALQACLPLLPEAGTGIAYLPAAVDCVRVWRRPEPTGLVHVRARWRAEREACFDITIADPTGEVAAQLAGCVLRRFQPHGSSQVQRYATVLRAAPRPGYPVGPDLGFTPPGPAQIVARSAPERTEILARWRASGHARFSSRGKRLAATFVCKAITELLPGQVEFTAEHLLVAGMLPKYQPLAALLLRLASEQGQIEGVDDRWWRLVNRTPDPEALFPVVASEFPGHSLALALYGRCGRNLARVLRGERDPVEMLFSDTERHFLDSYYAYSADLWLVNRLATGAIRALVAEWPADRPLRILEVGAGTGGMTAPLLAVLPPERTRYYFTDLSTGFFPRARARFRSYDFVEYAQLDLDQDPHEQGFGQSEFDLVIAANVLHATTDLVAALGRIRSLLASGGQLLAVEVHDPQLIALCFGLLDGFWSFTDSYLRSSSPLLPLGGWWQVLRAAGFTEVVRVGDEADLEPPDWSAILAGTPLDVPSPDTSPTGRPDAGAALGGAWLIAAEPPAAELGAAMRQELDHAGATTALLAVAPGVGGKGPDPAGDAGLARWSGAIPDGAGSVDLILVLGAAGASGEADPVVAATGRAAVIRAITELATQLDGRVEARFWLVSPLHHGLPLPAGLATTAADTTAADTTAADTAAADTAAADTAAADTAAAAAWATARVVANEQPRLRVTRIAFDPDGDPATLAARLVRELREPGDEDEVVLTRGGRFVPRVAELPATVEEAGDGGGDCTLRVSEVGMQYRLAWAGSEAPVPGPEEVLIGVRAAALNYRDILLATGLLPPTGGTAHLAGLECAGVVEAVGASVTGFRPGDPVFAMTPGCAAFGSRATAPAGLVARMPDGMSFSEAATLPVAWLTVHYGLEVLAQLLPGETVLVHGGAGGVGLAAIQYATLLGARVFATAGAETKRDLLHLLGAEEVFDSRRLDFATRIATLTNGRGVDVVLNSLAGEAATRSLEALAPGGRFVELGKRDLLANRRLLTRPLLHNLSFLSAHVDQLIADQPDAGHRHFAEMAQHVRDGRYRPLPHTVYPASAVDEAFRILQHSRHLGKVIVSLADRPAVPRRPSPPPLDPAASYLVTGGLGGFGAATARWLADRGARYLVLTGRRGSHSPEAAALVEDLRRRGADVTVRALDVTDAAGMRNLIETVTAAGRPLRGVVHAAMQLADAPLRELSDERFRDVLAPKLTGALVLHELTRHRPLDFFVVYSSATALVGNIGQSNYAAGNLSIEALIRFRKQSGLPGLAIGWGAIGETGYVARHALTESMTRIGLGSLAPPDALAVLEELLGGATAVVAVGRFDWGRFRAMLPAIDVNRFARVLPEPDADHGAGTGPPPATLAAMPEREATRQIVEILAGRLAGILQTPPDRLDSGRPLNQLGMDSLMATELAGVIRDRFGCDIGTVEVLNSTSLTELAHRVQGRLGRPAGDG